MNGKHLEDRTIQSTELPDGTTLVTQTDKSKPPITTSISGNKEGIAVGYGVNNVTASVQNYKGETDVVLKRKGIEVSTKNGASVNISGKLDTDCSPIEILTGCLGKEKATDAKKAKLGKSKPNQDDVAKKAVDEKAAKDKAAADAKTKAADAAPKATENPLIIKATIASKTNGMTEWETLDVWSLETDVKIFDPETNKNELAKLRILKKSLENAKKILVRKGSTKHK